MNIFDLIMILIASATYFAVLAFGVWLARWMDKHPKRSPSCADPH